MLLCDLQSLIAVVSAGNAMACVYNGVCGVVVVCKKFGEGFASQKS